MCPFYIAGDLFHTPDPPPSLINLAIQNLPDEVYAIAGQHDLFHHNTNSFGDTAYGTLTLSERITHVHPDGMLLAGYSKPIILYGLSWEQELKMPNLEQAEEALQILLAHTFCYWPGDKPFPDVDPHQTAWDYAAWLTKYGFHVAFLGDHHQDFIYQADDLTTIVNCGGILLRNIGEKGRQPKVYELSDDGTVIPIPLKSIEQDKWLDESQIGDKMLLEDSDIPEFVLALREIHDDDLLTFEGAVMNYINRKRPSAIVRALLLKSIGRYDQ